MNNGYKDYFKKARQNRSTATPVRKPNQNFKIKSTPSETAAEAQLKEMLMTKRPKSKKESSLPSYKFFASLFLGISIAMYGMYDPLIFEDLISVFEVNPLTRLSAEETKPAGKNLPPAKGDKQEKSATAKGQASEKTNEELSDWTNKEMSYFGKLNERKQELDAREVELVKLEEELHKQKVEIEKRIDELQNIRNQISGILNEKVKVDQEKVEKLVEFYSNMKPQQAAKTLSSLNEDLAVEVLGRMKKKNAAEIMNLLEPKKAQVLSEKFAGYKRR